jgi:hypothetical protein
MKRTSWFCHTSLAEACAVLLVAGSTRAASIAWVSFHAADNMPSTAAATAGFTEAPDKKYTDVLTAAGHTVTRFVGSNDFNVSTLAPHDLVILSRSGNSGWFDSAAETAAWNGLNKPVMIMSGYFLRNNRLGLHTGATIPDTTGNIKLNTTLPGSPVFTGIVFDGAGQTVNNYAGIVTFTPPDPDVVQRGISVVTNPLITGGVSLATVGASDGVGDMTVGGTIIGYFPAGLTTASGTPNVLGGRRLSFLSGSREMSITSEGAGIYDLTPVGEHLFLNAVTFLQNVPEPSTIGLAALAAAALGLVRRKSPRTIA